MSGEDLAYFLRRRMGELRLSNSDVATRAKISRQTWYRLLNAEVDEAKLSTMSRLANALNVHIMTLLRIYYDGKCLDRMAPHAVGAKKYASGFVADINYPNNSIVNINEEFTKTWEIINLGRSAWHDLYLQCMDEHLEVRPLVNCSDLKGMYHPCRLMPHATRIAIPETQSGQAIQLSVTFRAPAQPCSVISFWQAVDAEGNLMFPNQPSLQCQVKVVGFQNPHE